MSDEWLQSTLGEVAEVVGGGTPSTKEPAYWGGDIPWLTPTEVVRADGKTIARSDRTITSLGLAKSSANLLPTGAVLLTTRASVGFTAIAAAPLATNQGFQSLVPRDDLLPGFLMLWIQANREEFRSRAGGSTFPEVSKVKVRQIPITVPPLEVQRRIVDLMSRLDGLSALLLAEVRSASEFSTATRDRLVLGDGQALALGDVVLGISGGRSPATTGKPAMPEMDGVLKVSAVRPLEFAEGECKELPFGHPLTPAMEVQPGDVLITRANTPERVGTVCRVPPGVRSGLYLCDKTLRITPNPSLVDPSFLTHALNSSGARAHLSSSATGTSKSMYNVSQDKIRATPIWIPPLERQHQVADLLDSVLSTQRALEAEWTGVEKLRNQTLAAVLSRDVELPEAYDLLLDAGVA